MSAPAGSITISSFTAFDWLLVAVVLVSAAMAFRRGIIRVLFSLAGLIVGILVASWNYLSLAERIHPWVTSVPTAQILAFLTIILVVWFVFAAVAGFVRRAVKAVGLGFAGSSIGGCVRSEDAWCIVGNRHVDGSGFAFAPDSSWVRESALAPYFS